MNERPLVVRKFCSAHPQGCCPEAGFKNETWSAICGPSPLSRMKETVSPICASDTGATQDASMSTDGLANPALAGGPRFTTKYSWGATTVVVW